LKRSPGPSSLTGFHARGKKLPQTSSQILISRGEGLAGGWRDFSLIFGYFDDFSQIFCFFLKM
ncbi:MAG: hypothetical protein ACFN4U_04815, partial [Candidatus Absconditicoccaceae bacterium]